MLLTRAAPGTTGCRHCLAPIPIVHHIACRNAQQTAVPMAPSHPRGGLQRLQVVCMAHPRRVAKVASQIQREIGEMLVSDQVLANAVCPDRRLGGNSLSAVASITHVYVSNDLQVVKVYVSIYSDERGKQVAMQNLKRAEPYVRRVLGQRVVLRLTPEIRFEYDDSLEEAELVERVIGAEDVARFTAELDAEAGIRSGARPASAQQGSTGQAGGDADGSGFFDDVQAGDEVEDEGEYTEYSSDDVYGRPGPFDDLFVGVEPEVEQEWAREGRGGRGGRGRRSGRGGRGGQRRQHAKGQAAELH